MDNNDSSVIRHEVPVISGCAGTESLKIFIANRYLI